MRDHVPFAHGDDRTRALERAVALGDEVAARALLAVFTRDGQGGELVDRLPDAAPDGVKGEVIGPLMLHEVERLAESSPELLVEGSDGLTWLDARARASFGAVLRLRLLELERIAAEAPDRPVSLVGLRVALDVGGSDALARLVSVVREGPNWAAIRAAGLMADRSSSEAALHLAHLALEAPAEARARVYNALTHGKCPLGEARPLLARALAREKPELRPRAFRAFARVATDPDLQRLRREGAPDVRALAFEVIAARAFERSRRRHRPADLVLEALSDPAPELRRAAVRVLQGREWDRDPRAQGWLMGRLLDPDRTVKVEARKTLRRRELAPKDAPRLRTIAERAPPSQRPPIHRLADRAEK